MKKSIEVDCPCCATKLIIDSKTGTVISHERPAPDHEANFDRAMTDVRQGEQRRDDAFQKEFEKTQGLDDILDRKFEEAKKKAAKDTSKPHNPLDLD